MQLWPITPLSLLFSYDMKLKWTGNVYATNGVQHIKQIMQAKVLLKAASSSSSRTVLKLNPRFSQAAEIAALSKASNT